MKKNNAKIAIFFPHSPAEKNNSGVARLEMIDYLDDITYDIFHFGPSIDKNQFSIGPYYSEGNLKNIISFFKLLFTFQKQNKKNNYSAIWTTSPPIIISLFAAFLKNFFKTFLIIDVRDPAIASAAGHNSTNSFLYKLAFRLEKYSYQKADHVCVVTPELKEMLIHKFKIDRNKITVVYNATKEKISSHPTAKKPVKIFFGGTFSPYQIMDKVIENIIKNLPKNKNDYKFEFYGYNQTKDPSLQDLVNLNNCQNIIDLQPAIDRQKLFEKIKSCDISLVPISGLNQPELYDYAIPLKLYEAISFSKPILLFGGTKASLNLLQKHDIGQSCKIDDNIFDKIKLIVKKYSHYQKNSQATIYSRKEESKKLRDIIKINNIK